MGPLWRWSHGVRADWGARTCTKRGCVTGSQMYLCGYVDVCLLHGSQHPRAVVVFALMITASRPRNGRCFMSGQMLKFHLERIWENEMKLISFVHYFLICKGLSDLFSHLIHICADICLTLLLRVPHGNAETCTSAVSGGTGAGMQPSDSSHLVWPLASPDRETAAHRGKIFTGL